MTKQNLIWLAGVLLLANGCGGSGQQYPTGTVCPKVYDPFPVTIVNQPATITKLSLKPADNQIPEGKYTYASAAVYYYNKKTGLKIHYADVMNVKKVVFEPKIACLDGFKPGTEKDFQKFSTTGVSMMDVTKGQPPSFAIESYSIDFSRLGFQPDFKPVDPKTTPVSTPDKVYDNPDTTFAFYKMDPTNTNFEIRSETKRGDDAFVRLQIVLKRADHPKTN